MAQSISIASPLHSELLGNIVNMVIQNHLSRNQAKQLFEDAVDALDGLPYKPLPASQGRPVASKEKPSDKPQLAVAGERSERN